MLSFSLTAILLSVLSGLGFGAADYFRKAVPQDASPFLVMFYFIAGQLPVLGVWLALSGETEISNAYWLPGGATAVAGFFGNALFIVAIRRSPLSVIVPVLSLVPVVTALFSALILGERISLAQTSGMILVVVGLMFVLAPADARTPAALLSRVLREPGLPPMLIAGACWSLTPPLDKIAVTASSVPVHALIQVLALVIASGCWLLATGGPRAFIPARGAAFPLAGAAIGAGLAYASQLAAYLIAPVAIVELIKRVTSMASAQILGRFMLKEPVTASKTVGIVVIALGLPLVLLA